MLDDSGGQVTVGVRVLGDSGCWVTGYRTECLFPWGSIRSGHWQLTYLLIAPAGWFRRDAERDDSAVRGAADGSGQVPGGPEGHQLSGQQGVRP